jgi:predicted GNAT family acetyltransferase
MPGQPTTGRFELAHDGHLAFLEYRLGHGVIALIHTEVPPPLRGRGIGSSLAHTALEWARGNNLKVKVGCPFVAAYLEAHPEYSDLTSG